ncbi:MAG: DUF3363 domain-containing protein [Thiohalocapsa sp.]
MTTSSPRPGRAGARHRARHRQGLPGDQLGDCMHLVIDGRVHYVEIADATQAEDARIGGVVEVGRAPPRSRPSDRNISALAAETGVYRPREHRAIAEAGKSVCWAMITRATSRATSAGWRRCAEPASSRGSTPSTGRSRGLRGPRSGL